MRLIQQLKVSSKDGKDDLHAELEKVEEEISNEVSKDNRDKIVNDGRIQTTVPVSMVCGI